MTYTIRVSFGASPAANQAGWLTLSGDMPILQGSEKQIVWANDIRAKMARDLAAYLAKGLKISFGAVRQDDTALIAEVEAKFAAALSAPSAAPVMGAATKVFGTSSAKYWIDNRAAAITSLMEATAK